MIYLFTYFNNKEMLHTFDKKDIKYAIMMNNIKNTPLNEILNSISGFNTGLNINTRFLIAKTEYLKGTKILYDSNLISYLEECDKTKEKKISPQYILCKIIEHDILDLNNIIRYIINYVLCNLNNSNLILRCLCEKISDINVDDLMNEPINSYEKLLMVLNEKYTAEEIEDFKSYSLFDQIKNKNIYQIDFMIKNNAKIKNNHVYELYNLYLDSIQNNNFQMFETIMKINNTYLNKRTIFEYIMR